MKQINQKQAKVSIAKREPFNANSLKGGWFNTSTGWPSFGILPQEFRTALSGALETGEDVYVVTSYVTPIAWYSGGSWEIPDTKYSVTTSKHQTIVKVSAK
jgi:hypothetical protein